MNLEEAFLNAILDEPEDDTPRLIYADWLDDCGDPQRADFIRTQCELAKMPVDDPRRADLQKRERELLERNVARWVGPLWPLLTRWRFRRGFLDEVAVSVPVYLEHADKLRQGTVRRVEVDLSAVQVPQDVIEFVPESVARENVMFPLGCRGNTLVVAMPDPEDRDTIRKLIFILNRNIEVVPAPDEQIVEGIERHYGAWEGVDFID